MLVFDSKRYLFNVGDGIQRLASEHKLKLNSKLSDIFITALTPDTISGLPGLMMTLMQASEMRRTIHGPPGISAYIQASCTFMWNQFFDIVEYCNTDFESKPYRLTSQHFFQDANITVRALPLGVINYDFAALAKDIGTVDYKTSQFDTPRLGDAGKSGMCYIIEGPKLPGKFLAQRAAELGVKKGPLFGMLSKGNTIEVEGRIIRPEDVTEPSPPNASFAVVHSTSAELVSQLPYIPEYLSPTSQLISVVHLSSSQTILSPEYQSFVSRIPQAQHLVLNEDSSLESLKHNYIQPTQGAGLNLHKLNSVCPGLFPLHRLTYSQTESVLNYNFPFHLPHYLLKFGLSPIAEIGIDRTEVIKPLSFEPPQSVERSGWEERGPKYQEIVNCTLPNSDPAIMFLGTGAMKPEKYRNASGIWVGEWGGSLLLDCGESSYSQLLLHFGNEDIGRALSELSAILITHMHADHHLGLLKVLEERRKYTTSPLVLVAPAYMEYFLRTCTELFGDFNFQFFPCEALSFAIPGLAQVQAVLVDHCPSAYAFILKHESGWSLTYSGDTRPCEALVQAGQGSTVLIHEATVSDDLQEFAIEVKHSTISEAQDVFARMNAWRLIITHFSHRYAEVCSAEPNAWTVHAYDHLKIRLSECYSAPHWMAACIASLSDPTSSTN